MVSLHSLWKNYDFTGRPGLRKNHGGAVAGGNAFHRCSSPLFPAGKRTDYNSLPDVGRWNCRHIKPRLERAQADCTRIKIIDESKTPLRFDDTRLEAAVRQENARLLILDPLSAYIGESVSMNQANEVRSAFRSLYSMAQRTGCAVLIVAHMNKMNGISALYRTSGSIDVAGAVRSILTVTRYRKSPTQRVLVPVKSNLAPAGNGLLLEVTDHVEWLDQLEEADADQLLNGNQGPAVPTKQQQAEQGLLQLLQNGPVSHKEIILHFSRQGISKRTVELAKSNLPIKSIRIKDGWLWQLEEQP